MVLLLLRRKGRRAIFWPVGSDSWWVWGYHLHDPPMTHLHLVHGGLEVTPEVRLRTSSCGGSTRPERMILSSVCGSSTSKSSLSVLRGATLRCLSHCCEGKNNNIDSSLKVISTASSKVPFIFLSYCFFFFFFCLTCGRFWVPRLCLWIFHCEPLCSVLPNVTA